MAWEESRTGPRGASEDQLPPLCKPAIRDVSSTCLCPFETAAGQCTNPATHCPPLRGQNPSPTGQAQGPHSQVLRDPLWRG